jgi:hypothetical protein
VSAVGFGEVGGEVGAGFGAYFSGGGFGFGEVGGGVRGGGGFGYRGAGGAAGQGFGGFGGGEVSAGGCQGFAGGCQGFAGGEGRGVSYRGEVSAGGFGQGFGQLRGEGALSLSGAAVTIAAARVAAIAFLCSAMVSWCRDRRRAIASTV